MYYIVGKIREVLKLDEEMKYLARSLISEQPLLMFGRGYNYATTLEGADVLSKQQSVSQQLKARKGRLIVMCTEGDATAVCGGSCRVIEVPLVVDCFSLL
ncbi:hypothetical protein Tco_0670808 [Tanacetum coccineum]